MTVRRASAPSGSLLLTLSTTPSMSANMRAATPRGCIWAWLARRRVTMASSAITRPYRSETGSPWISSAIDLTIGPRHPGGEWAGLRLTSKLIGVEPRAYLAGLISRIVASYPQSRLDELLPWAYPTHPPSRRPLKKQNTAYPVRAVADRAPVRNGALSRADGGHLQPVRLHHRAVGRWLREAAARALAYRDAPHLPGRQFLFRRHAAAVLAHGDAVQPRPIPCERLPLELFRAGGRERRHQPCYDACLPGGLPRRRDLDIQDRLSTQELAEMRSFKRSVEDTREKRPQAG